MAIRCLCCGARHADHPGATGPRIESCWECQGFAEELTPAGPQLVIPGCERQTDKRDARQMTLFA